MQERIIVLAYRFGQQIETARRYDDIVHLSHGSQSVGHRAEIALDPQPDHGLPAEPHLQGIGDGHDLHDPGIQHALHSLPHSSLGQTYRLADAGIGAAAIFLELFDDSLGDIVQVRSSSSDSVVSVCKFH
jgi:hypothetical protein